MTIRYFPETDTLQIEFRVTGITETRELDEDTQVEVDERSQVCSMTIQHAAARTGMPRFRYEQIPYILT